ncbi:Lysine-specific demethylase JMJ25 isoform B [Glycine soja]|uniref:Lysine-specific demethylase JMJ25 isoform B n=1 Tax=Glycine soja TaxID=3848 RepID=A0A445I9Q8_GLYSO|nr:Lysine-specific demethylase JMJ25 isoform B [Glycine soja]
MGKKSNPAEGEEAVPEHLRCSRTDGRQWRCRRRVKENLKLCEIHYVQARRRQHKKTLKLKRKRQNDAVEAQIGAKRDRKSREALVNRRNQLELIRMVLQREVEKKKKKESQLNLNLNLHLYSNHELKKELPNGVMAIASNVASSRYFRSKNADSGSVSKLQEYLAGKNRVDGILHFHYLVCMLLPVLKQIKEDHHVDVEETAKTKGGKRTSDILIKPVDFVCNEKNYCNYCKTPILDLHRSCLSCSYSLCLSCSQALSQGSTSEEINSSISNLPDKINACISSESHLLDDKVISNGNLTDTSTLLEWTNCNGAGIVSCPPTKLGDCGDNHLDLKYVFPLSWIKEMEVKAEEIVCSYDFPETSDKSSSCSLCVDKDHKTSRYKQLPEAAQREDSNDNYLFYPTILDISCNHFEHFRKHWGKGHPVVVRDVLQCTPNLSWDPVVMFCTYLERSMTRYENNKDLLEACLDWFEVEINVSQYFIGPLKCQPQKNTWHEMLKLKGWLSSQLFKEQFPAHFAEVIDALPIQEYMNPLSGLLNLAANLPQGSTKHDIGPYVYISYGCADEGDDFVTNLCYDSYDMVNIMAYSMDIPLSTDQLAKISKLLKKHKTLCQKVSSKTTSEHSEDREQNGMHSIVKEGTDFLRRVNRTSSISTEAKTISNQKLDTNISDDEECGSDSETEKAQSSLPSHRRVLSTERSPDHNPRNPFENSNSDKGKKFTENSAAHWDVFRRQDVPKLLEYLKRHSDEFSYTSECHEKMVHPILDQSFFLDNTHKMRLKEEFKIEPWTFEQHVGEAVIIPSGCPYQIRNPKCCVHVELEFVSPENVSECIQLIDEVRLLPEDHKAKVEKLEVKKMALYSMSTAIKEIRELTCKT